MKKILISGFVSAALALASVGCSDSAGPVVYKNAGRISLQVDLDAAVNDSRNSRAEYSDITAADLSLKLTSADGSFSKTWTPATDFDAEQTFPIGNYTIEAFYGEPDAEGFEKPYFYASQDIKIEENKATPVTLEASLANAMVSVTYSEAFRNYMSDWNAEVHGAGGTYTFFRKDETRPAYVNAGNVELNVSFTKPNGKEGQFKAANFTAAPRTHYHMNFDLAYGTGESAIVVEFDPSLKEEPVKIDISDEVLNAPGPELEPEGFTSGELIKYVAGAAPERQLRLNLVARGGIGQFNLTTQSPSLHAAGWPEEIDLVAAPENIQQRLKALGFASRGIFTNPDKLAVIDITKVMDNVTDRAVLSFQVVDKYCKVSEVVTITFEVLPLEISLSNPSTLAVGATAMNVDLHYNGADPEHRVTIKYQNDRGTWTPLTVTYPETATQAADDNYSVRLTGLPANAATVNLKAECGNVAAPTVAVSRVPVQLDPTVDEADVFATHATIRCAMTEANPDVNLEDLVKLTKVMLSKDGSAFAEASCTTEGTAFHVVGLAPASTYTVKLQVAGASLTDAPTATFTTEAATQLPNADMENWTENAIRSNNVEYFCTGWGTLNSLTISQNNFLNLAYVAASGTTPTQGISGQGALLRTIAWGSGNTAAGGASIIKHVDRAELFLGTFNSTNDSELPAYGIDFASRPSALRFYYKFEEAKSRKGYVEIKVLDASGAVIAQNQMEIGSQGSWTPMNVPLTYTKAAKAAKLSVIFRSTNVGKPLGDGTALGKSDINTNGSRTSPHTGSQLYIDDIELIY